MPIFKIEGKQYNIPEDKVSEFQKAKPSAVLLYNSLSSMFEEQVDRTPDNIAIVYEEIRLCYRELNERANRLANYLIEKYNICPDDLIGLCLDRSEHMLIAILAVLKSGAAYVPIDPSAPDQRISYITSDTSPKVLLTNKIHEYRLNNLTGSSSISIECVEQTEFVEYLSSNYSSNNPNRDIKPEHLAYVIYTSGTTGNPKGVMIEHKNAVNLISGSKQFFTDIIGHAEEYIHYMWYYNYVFDAHVLEIYPPLAGGHCLCMTNGDTRFDLQLLKDYIIRHQIVVASLPPILLDKENILPLEVIKVGGELTNQEVLNKYIDQNIKIINIYGPTEITVASNCHLFEKDEKNTYIGKYLPNYTGYILNENMLELPDGAIGELYIGGDSVARGYLHNEKLTTKNFITNPFQTEAERQNDFNNRLYKTGDTVRKLPNGNLEFIGRNDSQIKIRGFRIELGEIEARLLSHPDIKSAVVLPKGQSQDSKYLAAYYVSDHSIDAETIAEYIGQFVPDYMIPSVFVHVPKIPMTASGKVDTKSLPEPQLLNLNSYEPPKNETEKSLVSTYSEVLNRKVSEISVEDSFFKLGGNSILAIRLVDKVKNRLNRDIKITDIFTYKTIRKLANFILQNNIKTTVDIPVSQIKNIEDQSLSFAQERLWFIESYEGGSNTYNIPLIFRLTDIVNTESLVAAIKEVVQRHQILRTVIRLSNAGTSFQEVLSDNSFHVDILSIDSKNDLESKLSDEVNHIFRLDQEFPVRAKIFNVSENDRYISIILHHIAFDGWSINILTNEILNNYHRQEAIRSKNLEVVSKYTLPNLPIQYKDFAIWQKDYLTGNLLDKQVAFWKQHLSGYEPLNLPTDKLRPSRIDYTGDTILFTLDKSISENIRNLAKQLDVSLYSILLSGYYLLLSVYSNQNNIVVGTPVANRNYKELYNLIGFFVNTLVLRQEIDKKQKISNFIKQVNNLVMEVQDYQDLPFEKLVDELNVKKDTSRNPIFQAMFGLQSFGNEQENDINQLLEPLEIGNDLHVAKFDLTVLLDDSTSAISGSFNYATSLFNSGTIKSYISTYKIILEQFALLCESENRNKCIDEMQLLNDADYKKLVYDRNIYNNIDVVAETIQATFERQVEKTPEHTAIVYKGTRLTYRELNERANRLATYLTHEYNIRPDDMIALCLDRSENIVISILAVLKTGAAYVPMNPSAPSERLAFMIADISAKIVLTTTEYKESIRQLNRLIAVEAIDSQNLLEQLESYSCKNIKTETKPQNLAYVIYTSGTTGNPKGVMVEHHNVINLFKPSAKLYNFNDSDVWTLFHSYTFDFSVWELWGSLFYGGKLVIPSYEETRNTDLFYDLCLEEGVTILNQTPSAFYQFVDVATQKQQKQKTLRYVIFGGEALNTTQLKSWYQIYEETAPALINMYGITETTVFATYPQPLKIADLDKIPSIGIPLDGYTAYILDANRKPLTFGAIGELYLGGVGVTRGYLNNPELTAERFIPNPFQTEEDKIRGFNSTIYKSGDLVRYNSDGEIEYVGRNDFQVKIRGFRIELEEIKSRLSSYPSIKQSVVLVKEYQTGVKYLAAYYVADNEIEAKEIRSYLSEYLPDYMIPAFFIHIHVLPLTLNGKLDHFALPEPNFSTQNYVAPQNAIEETLCAIFGEILNIDSKAISVENDFFELGGNSIMATKLIYLINEAFESKIKIIDLFMAKTIKNLASLVNQDHYTAIVQLNKSLSKKIIFMVHPGGGGCEAYLSLAQKLEPYYQCYGIDSYNLYNKDQISDLNLLATYYLSCIKNIENKNSFIFLGWSLGGLIALEMASILETKGVNDIQVYLLDTVIKSENEKNKHILPSDDEIREIIKKYNGIEFNSAKKYLNTELTMSDQTISNPLLHTNVLLFQAMVDNPIISNKSTIENLTAIAQKHLVNVVKVKDASHCDILNREELILQYIPQTEIEKNSKLDKPLLITFPFAGGNSYSYRNLITKLESDYEIVCTEIPGRGKLIDKSLLDDLNKIVDFLFDTNIRHLDLNRPYILYGHSMGALLSYLMYHKIREHKLPLPIHLVVSGRMGPSVPVDKVTHGLTSSGFWKKITEMDGIPQEILDSEDMKIFFEPILRSDFKAVETFEYKPVTPIDIPITVLYGSQEGIEDKDLRTWEIETSKTVEYIKMDGNHFFIYNHLPEISSYLSKIVKHNKANT